MTHSALRQWFYAQLSALYLQGELQSMYHWCVKEIHGWSRAEVYTRNDDSVAETDLSKWKLIVERLAKNEPIQYIFQKASFFDFELFVDENVLIPRPETEELVQMLLDENASKELRVLDIGTGSGCIPLALKKARPIWQISGCDISDEALQVARKNSLKLELEVDFFQADVVQLENLDSLDIIISNPPYIPVNRKESLEANVLEHEPHIALFSPKDDAFYFFRVIAEVAMKSKVKKVCFETHATEMEELVSALTQIWKGSVRKAKDLGGKERFIILES